MKIRYLDFRNWLIARVAETRWASIESEKNMTVSELAVKLGVQPDVIIEALDLRLRSGKSQVKGEALIGRTMNYLHVAVIPRVMLSDFDEMAKVRGISRAMLGRSIIHEYLSNTREPDLSLGLWNKMGFRYRDDSLHRMSFRLNKPAMLALSERAEARGCSALALTNAILHEAMLNPDKTTRAKIGVKQLWALDRYQQVALSATKRK